MKEQKSNPMARIWEIAKPEHGKLLMSVIIAVLGVVSGIVPFVSAAKIISGMIWQQPGWQTVMSLLTCCLTNIILL